MKESQLHVIRGSSKKPLDIYDDMPDYMKKYISNYGWHFNRKAYRYAVEFMSKEDSDETFSYSKEQVDNLLNSYGIVLKNRIMHDYVYVATMAYYDYFGSSIEDEHHLAKFIKDYVDDVDASDETPFRRWVATMVGNGNPIDWEELI